MGRKRKNDLGHVRVPSPETTPQTTSVINPYFAMEDIRREDIRREDIRREEEGGSSASSASSSTILPNSDTIYSPSSISTLHPPSSISSFHPPSSIGSFHPPSSISSFHSPSSISTIHPSSSVNQVPSGGLNAASPIRPPPPEISKETSAFAKETSVSSSEG